MPTTLATLPPELHITLFELLDPDTSTCLGLTCTNFYAVHDEVQRRLNRNLLVERPGPFQPASRLPILLQTWMGCGLVYGYPYTHNFVSRERLVELKRKWAPWLLMCKATAEMNPMVVHIKYRGTWVCRVPERIELDEGSIPMALMPMKEFSDVSRLAHEHWYWTKDLDLYLDSIYNA